MAGRLSFTVQAVSDSAGNLVFTFPAPGPGNVWTGAVFVDQAPATLASRVTVGGVPWGSATGGQALQVQMVEGDQLVVTATGAAASTSYSAYLNGSAQTAAEVAQAGYLYPFPAPPAANPGAPTGGISKITSTGGSVTVTNATGPTVNLEVVPGAAPIPTRIILPAFPASTVASQPATTDLSTDQPFTCHSTSSVFMFSCYGSMTAFNSGGGNDVGYFYVLLDGTTHIIGGESGAIAGDYCSPMAGTGPFWMTGLSVGVHQLRAQASSDHSNIVFGFGGSMPAGWGSLFATEFQP